MFADNSGLLIGLTITVKSQPNLTPPASAVIPSRREIVSAGINDMAVNVRLVGLVGWLRIGKPMQLNRATCLVVGNSFYE